MSKAGGFALLWGKILQSSIWMEDYPTRLVWITILAMKDENGFVKSSPLVLAHLARVEPAECQKALQVFLNPDPNSGITAHEGRRLEEKPGGWQVLNHEEYQFSTQAKREFWKEQKRRQRERDASRKVSRGGRIKSGKPLPGEKAFSEAQANGELRKAEGILDQHLPAESKVSQFPDGPDIEHEPVPGHVTKVEDWGNANPVPPAAPVQRDPWQSRSEESFPEV